MLAVNVETQEFCLHMEANITKKLESVLLYMNFSVAEPAICEHT
jgi:hypothetical protein